MHGGQLPSPIELDDRITLITELLGVATADIRLALDSLRGSLVLLVETPAGPKWTFKHPTIGDAYAASVADSPELTEIYLRGAKLERLLEEVVCGDTRLRGASVNVGPSLYLSLLKRLLVHPFDYRIRYFLGQRSDDAFLKLFAEQRPQILDIKPTAFMSYSSENRLLAKLHAGGLLPEEKRLALIEHIVDVTVNHQDGAVFRDDSLRSLFTDLEFSRLLERIRVDVLKSLDSYVSEWKSNCSDDDADSHFDELKSFLNDIARMLPEDDPDQEEIQSGLHAIRRAIDSINESRDPFADTKVETPVGKPSGVKSRIATIFDDVDE
jgi:hypothetical protein